MMKIGLLGLGLLALPMSASAQTPLGTTAQPGDLQAELAAARGELARQRQQLDEQERRLRELEQRMTGAPAPTSGPSTVAQSDEPAAAPPTPTEVQTVGVAPTLDLMPLDVSVLGSAGSAIASPGAITGEVSFEYARADRNRALFRGVEVLESVLIGVFDINENRQDVLTASGTLRYGITPRLEIGTRIPYVYRNDRSILAPVAGSSSNDIARTRDLSSKGDGLGDIEFSARYQLTQSGPEQPFLVANLQVVVPTGTNAFELARDDAGRPTQAATGAGFWGISPSITAILPTDPAVLFGTLGYTFNLARNVNTRIPPVIIERVNPGDSISGSAGIGVSLNQRTSFNLGYAHTWAFGTDTLIRPITPPRDGSDGRMTNTTRDLQIGRLLFGVTYRASDLATLNWTVEVGATDDAPDVRTVLRIPFALMRGG